MKVKLALLAFVLLVAGISKSEAQHYRYEKKHSRHYKKSYGHSRAATVVYYPAVRSTRYYAGRPYPVAYRQPYYYRHHRHVPPGHAKKYYRHHRQHKRVHHY